MPCDFPGDRQPRPQDRPRALESGGLLLFPIHNGADKLAPPIAVAHPALYRADTRLPSFLPSPYQASLPEGLAGASAIDVSTCSLFHGVHTLQICCKG